MTFAGRVRNVLVFPAGTEAGLEIYAALHSCKEVRLYAAGIAESNHAQFIYRDYHCIPYVSDPEWLDRLKELCGQLQIDYIIPAHDDAVLALMRHHTEIPAQVLTSPLITCEVARSKRTTYELFAGKLRVPLVFDGIQAVEHYPVFVKPDRGQGSQGAVRIDNPISLTCAMSGMPDPLICEFFPGEEYTVDCFSDRERGLMFAGARQRVRTRNGIASNTRTVSLPEAEAIAQRICNELDFHGAWFFQLKRDTHGVLGLLEVAPRVAGSMAAHRVRGLNFPLMSIFESERLPLKLLLNETHVALDRALANRYAHPLRFTVAYVDLDDTLLVGDKVNLDVVSFVFQCINAGKPVHLITRHRGDLVATLRQYRLTGLFDRIVHVGEHEYKSAHIHEPTAILIDDSFAERQEVATRCGIQTFDCSMLEIFVRQAASDQEGNT